MYWKTETNYNIFSMNFIKIWVDRENWNLVPRCLLQPRHLKQNKYRRITGVFSFESHWFISWGLKQRFMWNSCVIMVSLSLYSMISDYFTFGQSMLQKSRFSIGHSHCVSNYSLGMAWIFLMKPSVTERGKWTACCMELFMKKIMRDWGRFQTLGMWELWNYPQYPLVH